MDIQKKDNYRKKLLLLLCTLAFGAPFLAYAKEPIEALRDSYNLPNNLTPETVQKTISELNQAMVSSSDPILNFRIQYRVGMLYFKNNDLLNALDSFVKVSETSDCPELIKFCGLNMSGQIYRMQAKDEEALKLFGDLIDYSQTWFDEDTNVENPASVLKLAATAGFSRAEIYQYNQDYKSAISEYERVLVWLNPDRAPFTEIYAPRALDRLSQLYLITGENESYDQSVGELVKKYSSYYRTGIIQFEKEAVQLLQEQDHTIEFSRGSFDAPARLIALMKESEDKIFADSLNDLLKKLCSQYDPSYSGILLKYYHAWLLDTMGDSKQAAKLFEDVCKQATLIDSKTPTTVLPVINTLTDYAKLQRAIILGEETQYKDALDIVDSVTFDPNEAHLFNLADTIKKTLETLKREVPKDAANE